MTPFGANHQLAKHLPQKLQTEKYLSSVLILSSAPLTTADDGVELFKNLVDAATSGWLLPLVGVGIFLWASIMWALVLIGIGIGLILRNQFALRDMLEGNQTGS